MTLIKYNGSSNGTQTTSGGGSSSAGVDMSQIASRFLPATRIEDEDGTGYEVSEKTTFVTQLHLVTEDGTKVATMAIDANGRFYFDKGIISAEDIVAYGVEDDEVATVQQLIQQQIVANPTGTASATITSLGINGVKYNIEGGGGGTTGGIIWGGISGSGNAVTAINYDSQTGTLSAVKGSTFLTEHQDISGKANRSELANYLPLAGGTMSGDIALPLSKFIKYNGTDYSGGLPNYGFGWTTDSQGRQCLVFRSYFGIELWSNSTYGGPIKINSKLTVTDTITGTLSGNASSSSSCSGNSATATKLANARTIWGQSFDGSANVSGTMTLDDLIYNASSASQMVGGIQKSGAVIGIRTDGTVYRPQLLSSDGNIVFGVARYDANKWGFLGCDANGKITLKSCKNNAGSLSVDASGNVVAAGDVTAYSDARLKSDIKPLEYRGELHPKTYIKDGKKCIGFVAQEVRKIYPELVLGEESDTEYLSLNYGAITAVLAAENKMLKKKIESLEDRLAKIEELLRGGER